VLVRAHMLGKLLDFSPLDSLAAKTKAE